MSFRSVPFSIGSMIYYVRDELPVFGRSARLAAVGTFALHASLARVLWRVVTMGGVSFYVPLGLVALVVARAPVARRGHASGR